MRACSYAGFRIFCEMSQASKARLVGDHHIIKSLKSSGNYMCPAIIINIYLFVLYLTTLSQ
jgi:hypothetical protein